MGFGWGMPGSMGGARPVTWTLWPPGCDRPGSGTCSCTWARFPITDFSTRPCGRVPGGCSPGWLHQRLPKVRVQAWLGDLVGPGHLDLAEPATRIRVLRAATQVLTEGFDGIHYDLEPVPSGDRGYLALLAATHTLTLSRHKIFSVAADQIEPLPYLHIPEQWIFGTPHWWSSGYLHAVATRADEIAVMTYNSGVPFGPAYSGYVRLETQLALAAVPPAVTLLIGLPAYHTSEPGHTSAETVAAAIRGVRLALGTHPQHRAIGVALYADFSASPTDWNAYLANWALPRVP